MKSITIFMLTLAAMIVAPLSASAALVGAPFIPELDSRLDKIEQAGILLSPNEKPAAYPGIAAQPLVHIVYDFAKYGGASTASPFYSGVTLPPNSLITRGYFHVTTGLTETNTYAYLSLYCAGGGDIIMPATIPTGLTANTLHELNPTGASSAFIGLDMGNLPCPLYFAVTGQGNLTAGKIEFFLNYVVVK